jgi:hypothetical protein
MESIMDKHQVVYGDANGGHQGLKISRWGRLNEDGVSRDGVVKFQARSMQGLPSPTARQ